MELTLQLVSNETGKRLDVSLGPKTTIGRKIHNHLQIREPYVSAKHAVITRSAPGCFVVEDCGSLNGTFVNNHAVVRPVPIKAGDVLRFGKASCSVVLAELPNPGLIQRQDASPGPSQPVAAVDGGKWRLNSGLRSSHGRSRAGERSYRTERQDRKLKGKKPYFARKHRPTRSYRERSFASIAHQI